MSPFFPQEIVDEIVDIVAARSYPLSGCLGASKMTSARARLHLFNKVEFIKNYTPANLEKRLALLSDIIADPGAPASSLCNAGLLIKTFTMTVNGNTERIMFSIPNDALFHIFEALSRSSSNLTTLNLRSINHVDSVNQRFGAALAALCRAPKLRTFGVHNIPFGQWEQLKGLQLESFYAVNAQETTGLPHRYALQRGCRDCKQLLPVSTYGPSALQRFVKLQKSMKGGFGTITNMVVSVAFFVGVIYFHKDASPREIMPSLVKAILYLDISNSFPVVSWILNASNGSLEELELVFDRCDSILDGYDENSALSTMPFSLRDFPQLKYLTLSVALLEQPLGFENRRHAVDKFLEAFLRILRDIPKGCCSLRRMKLVLDWKPTTEPQALQGLMIHHPLWKELDILLSTIISFSAHDLHILLQVSMPLKRHTMNTYVWKQTVVSSVPLPKTRATGKFLVLSPEGDERPGIHNPSKVMGNQSRLRDKSYFISQYRW